MMLRVGYLLFLLPWILSAQISLVKEESVNGHYRLTYSNAGYSYSIQERNQERILSLTEQTESNEQQFPSRSIFLALPPFSQPNITASITKHAALDAELIHPKQLPSLFYEVKGYLWIDNYYCAHVVVHPFTFINGQPVEIKEFRVDVDLPLDEGAVEHRTHRVADNIIDNPRYGSQWKVARPVFPVSQTDSWINYSNDYVKLGVVADGIYRLRYNDLLSYGVPVSSVDPKTLKIYMKGKEQPIYVFGEGDNVFNQNDYIEFLGRRNYGDLRYREPASPNTSYYEYLNRYSDTTIYWLTWGGTAGRRIDTVSASNIAMDTLRYYDQLLRRERNQYWDFSLAGGDLRKNDPEILENETWVESALGVGKSSIPFTITDLYPNKPARAFAKVQDYASTLLTDAHNTALSINNTATKYDSGFIDKFEVKVLKAQLSSSVLKNGTNTVEVHSFAVSGNTVNTIAIDWYELEYPRYLKTTTDSLNFAYNNLSSSTYAHFIVTGLTSGTHSLYKFNSADSSIRKITNVTRSNDTLRFADSVTNGTYYFLLREDKIPSPIFFYKKKFTNLRSTSRQADYIAITHPVFLPSATSYASFISSTYGVTTAVIDVNDIYDEFNYGFFAPEPIREFLKATHIYWQLPKPKYVFLIGKGTYDFYGNKTRYFGAPKVVNFVPSYGNPVSDIWFVLWDPTGALIPQMNIGRVPARNVEEFQSYATKHQKYVVKGFDDWNKRYMFFAGGNFTNPGQIAQSKGVNDYIINNYVLPPPIGGSAVNFYKTTDPITNFGPYSSEYIKNAIEQGGVFISYIGHSGTQTWDNSITDVSQLANIRDRNPLITDFGCSTAKFAEPDVLSFSELAVNSLSGQAIGYVGNSSLGFESTAFTFPRFFYKKLLIDTSASLGDVHRLAKIDYIKQYGVNSSYGLFVKTNELIGDPIVKLPIPTKPNFSFTNAAITIQPESPTDISASMTVTLNYNNYGAVIGDSIVISIRDEYQGMTSFSTQMKQPVPRYADSITFSIPIFGKAGVHTVTVSIDSANSIEELSESDNTFVRNIFVATTTIRNLSDDETLNQTDGMITYLNPTVSVLQPHFLVDVSEHPSFSQKQTYQVPFDTFFTSFRLNQAFQGKRVWVQTKVNETAGEGLVYSYRVGTQTNFLIADSISFSKVQVQTAKVLSNQIRLDSSRITFSAISAGVNDGNTAVITKNGQNFVPENTLRGYHVCWFDKTTFAFGNYMRFDVFGSAAEATAFKTLLDTLPPQYIVIMAISNAGGGGNLNSGLISSIKSYGSMYIDSVKNSPQVTSSWAMIGYKGALAGTVPEKFSKTFQGRVKIDTTIVIPDSVGSFETPSFGPVAEWRDVSITASIPNGSTVRLAVVGVKDSGIDTVVQTNIVGPVVDLSSVDATQYPQIKLVGSMTANTAKESPAISSIAINYNSLPELGTNYQAVQLYVTQNGNLQKPIIAGDTITQGEKIKAIFRVYNAGGVTVKNVPVKIGALWENNYSETIATVTIDSLPPKKYKELSGIYNTSLGFGKRNIQFTIDPDTVIRERYRDNNYFVVPIVIKRSDAGALFPNLAIAPNNILPEKQFITDQNDSVRFRISYANTGLVVGDSISIAVKHFYKNSLATQWTIRRLYPSFTDTIVVTVPILKRAGEHQLQVELDPFGLIAESSESDNAAVYFFTVSTTAFSIVQPSALNTSAVSHIIFLNPTSSLQSGQRIALLELDTQPTFASAMSVQVPMQEFTTTYNITTLPKKKRYYWRIKELNTANDWTEGTFYLGDSTSFAWGQIDSASWAMNSFSRVAYSPDSGARIVDTKFTVNAVSAGFNDGNTGSVTVNTTNIIAPIFGNGHNVVVLDTINYQPLTMRRFNITNNPNESDSLVQFLSGISTGLIVIDVVVDEGANNLQPAARNALKSIGSAYIDQLQFRDSWAIIGRKGAMIGSVPEVYKAQGTGSAMVDTTFVRKETSGTIITPSFGSFARLSHLSLNSVIPSGAQLTTTVLGIKPTGTVDTVISAVNQQTISMAVLDPVIYPNAQLLFDFKTSSSHVVPVVSRGFSLTDHSPRLYSWTVSGVPPLELAVSSKSTSLSADSVMEGEDIVFTTRVYNFSSIRADSIPVRLKTTQLGIETVVKEEMIATLAAQDSVTLTYTYSTRERRGNRAFVFEIDPLNTKIEVSKNNNSVTLPFRVVSDSIKPKLQITINGKMIVDGDYVNQQPEIRISYIDNNPTFITQSDTTNFRLRLNGKLQSFTAGNAELIPSTSPGKAEIRWTPMLDDGDNVIEVYALDIAGNISDTIVAYVKVASQFRLLDVYTIPNPFNRATHFTFNLAGPVTPDEVIIKIYTVAGRLIHEIRQPANIGFNKIYWDGRDSDGDEIGNGVYLYKVLVNQQDVQVTATSKLVKMK